MPSNRTRTFDVLYNLIRSSHPRGFYDSLAIDTAGYLYAKANKDGAYRGGSVCKQMVGCICT